MDILSSKIQDSTVSVWFVSMSTRDELKPCEVIGSCLMTSTDYGSLYDLVVLHIAQYLVV